MTCIAAPKQKAEALIFTSSLYLLRID